MARTPLAWVSAILASYVSAITFLGNEPPMTSGGTLPRDLVLRRNFLIRVLSHQPSSAELFGTAEDHYVGEWTFGTYAMATYALTNIAMSNPETADESSRVIATWIDASTDDRLNKFDADRWNERPLDPRVLHQSRGHIAYYGQLNLMLGCYALLNHDGRFRVLHETLSAAIARRMAASWHRQVESYPGETYPLDNTVAAASLRIADVTLHTQYGALVDQWVEQSKRLEDPTYGLIVFQIDSQTGTPLQTCRGSGSAWNSFFLPLVDEAYAAGQFQRFTQQMLRRVGAFAAFREYPRGGWFSADVDTGPVIFGLGGTATGFAVAGARWAEDAALFSSLLRSVELLGVSVTRADERRYIAAPIVGEAILLATRTAQRWKPLWRPE